LTAAPDGNHIVPYDVLSPVDFGTTTLQIYTTLHVYLVDPNTTDTPIITDHRLNDQGIHCGYDHGSNVWIRYIEPSPRFTAEQWAANITYSKGDTVYSFTSGECYRSTVSNNFGNDPSVTGVPVTIPSAVTQQYKPPQLGNPGQDKITYVDIHRYQGVPTNGGPFVHDPPVNGSIFFIPVYSNVGVLLGSATHTATGTQSLDVIGADLASQLTAALGVGWTLTYDSATKTVRLDNASNFVLSGGSNFPYYKDGVSLATRLLILEQIQAFVPASPPTGVTPQILVVTFSQQQLVPGALYTFTFADRMPPTQGPNMVSHIVNYQSDPGDGVSDILGGIANAIVRAATTDQFFVGISVSVDLTGNTISIISNRVIAVDTTLSAPSAYWIQLLFPQALVNAVVRGASADFLQEWGEVQSGLAVAQGVGVPQDEPGTRDGFQPKPNTPLTNQQEPTSRYKIKP
jgi:hypothetical protein